MGIDVVTAARAWIGTPYVHQASVKGVGCDCLGLLRGVWRELHGAEPEAAPPYSPDWAETTGAETMYLALKRHLVEITPRDRSALATPPAATRAAKTAADSEVRDMSSSRANSMTSTPPQPESFGPGS